jgi:7-cyano-7-deazaguanine synthase
VCSIFGALGRPNQTVMDSIIEQARDRGRDDTGVQTYDLHGISAVLGNHRAVPTPEVERAPVQPYDGVVHNGTIANDDELGVQPGEVDSMVLPRVLDRSSFKAFHQSVQRIKGSFAIAATGPKTIYLAANYRPLHFIRQPEATYFASLEHHLDAATPAGCRPAVLPPYTVMDLRTLETLPLPRRDVPRTVVVASAGLDSTTVAACLKAQGHRICLLHFDYGCRARSQEWKRVQAIAKALECESALMTLPYVVPSESVTLLSEGRAVAESVAGAEYAHEWVPARNLAMAGLAIAYAEANGYHAIALGNNLEEAGAYPDNEEQMYRLLDQVCDYAVQDGYRMRVLQPVGHLMKHEIVRLGLELGVPYELTWSCYQGGPTHCGKCGPCFMRREAFRRNGAVDPVMETVQ